MYKLQATEPFEETLIGEPTDPTQIDITLNANGWTWMGYPAQAANSLNAALAEAEPMEGDIVKNQTGFAFYTEGEWLGTLGALTPGDGYMYYSHAATAKTFRFPRPTSFGRTNAPVQSKVESRKSKADDDFINPKASSNMTMIAGLVESQKSKVESIRAYIGEELVGVAEPMMVDDEPLYFLTVQSDAVGTLQFETADGTPLTATVNCQLSIINYQPDAHAGSLKAPVILTPVTDNPSSVTAPYKVIEDDRVIIIRNGERYDVTGVRQE